MKISNSYEIRDSRAVKFKSHMNTFATIMCGVMIILGILTLILISSGPGRDESSELFVILALIASPALILFIFFICAQKTTLAVVDDKIIFRQGRKDYFSICRDELRCFYFKQERVAYIGRARFEDNIRNLSFGKVVLVTDEREYKIPCNSLFRAKACLCEFLKGKDMDIVTFDYKEEVGARWEKIFFRMNFLFVLVMTSVIIAVCAIYRTYCTNMDTWIFYLIFFPAVLLVTVPHAFIIYKIGKLPSLPSLNKHYFHRSEKEDGNLMEKVDKYAKDIGKDKYL